MNIRPAVPADAEAIACIRITAWRAAYFALMPAEYLASLEPHANVDSLRRRIASPTDGCSLTVAELEGKVVAFSIMGPPRYESSPGCVELWALNVLPEHWRKGIGRNLTTQAVTAAASLDANRIELWCIKGNIPAQAAYESCGFVLTGRERASSSLTGHPLHELLYSKTL